MALNKIGTFFDTIINPSEYSDTGSAGERFLYRELKQSFFSNILLRNVYLPKKSGNLSEIDLLAVSRRGVFVFESKNYSGTIFGEEDDTHWTQMLNRNTKNRFYNPIRQNNSHINTLRYHLQAYPDMRYYNFVVFSEQCALRIKPVSFPYTYVINRDALTKTIDEITDAHQKIISSGEKKEIIKLLSNYSRPGEDTRGLHIDQINTKCPYCGNDLVERANKENGNKFYGCKSYPRCRFTKPIPQT